MRPHGSELSIHGAGLNTTRAAVVSVLRSMGALIQTHPETDRTGNPSGILVVRKRNPFRGGEISGAPTAERRWSLWSMSAYRPIVVACSQSSLRAAPEGPALPTVQDL